MPFDLNSTFSLHHDNAHPHACIVFDDPACYRNIAASFILQGLEKNEKCIMAVDRYKPSLIKGDFADQGWDMDRHVQTGALTVINVKESYSASGSFDPDKTIEIWKRKIKSALDEGYEALRVVGEASFALGRPELVEKLVYYENSQNQELFKQYPIKSLCVYEKGLYPPEIIKAVIKTHPILFYNDELFAENIHYIPPEIYFKANGAEEEIDLWLGNVRKNNQNIKALKEKETRFRAMFEEAPMSYQSLDGNGNFIEVNDTWLSVLGYERKEVMGKNFSDFLLPELQDHFRQNFPRFRAVGEILGVEFEMVKKDGTLILVSFTGKVARDGDDNFMQTHCLFQDITDRRRAEAELKQSKEWYELLFNSSNDGIFIYPVEQDGSFGTFVQVNRVACQRLGYSHRELLQLKPVDINDAGSAESAQTKLKKLMANGSATFDAVHLTKKGRRVPVEISSRLFSADGRTMVISVVRDVSDQLKMAERLRQSQKMEAIGSLAGGIAHDFNNILFPVVALSEMLVEDFPQGSPEREHASAIHRAGKRGSELVKQILAFSRKSEEQPLPVQFQKVLEEVVKLCRSTIPSDIAITPDIQSDCGIVMADATRLHQVAMNLITNAYHAVEPTHGEIAVGLAEHSLCREEAAGFTLEPGDYAVFTVSDNGPGIDSSLMNKIFDPYFTTKEKGKGTGLGLSVVHGIVTGYGGDIKVYSESGRGTSFTVYLPLMEKEAEAGSKKDAEPVPRGNEHILLVDDEEPIVQLEKNMLQRLGYRVTCFTKSTDALAAFKASPGSFDLVITDMTMPEMTGDQLATALLAIKKELPVILATGFSKRIDRDQARSMGIKGFLGKPVVRSEMGKTVRELLDGAAEKTA